MVRAWRRLANYLRWRRAVIPVLLNLETGELLEVKPFVRLPKGTWLLRRPLTLPESSMTLFLGARVFVR
jgi:hypothetical protein